VTQQTVTIEQARNDRRLGQLDVGHGSEIVQRDGAPRPGLLQSFASPLVRTVDAVQQPARPW
jgi:hypothetical protein